MVLQRRALLTGLAASLAAGGVAGATSDRRSLTGVWISDRYFFWLSDQSRVTERFTRTGPAEILYSFMVEDPVLLTQPWRGELLFTPSHGAIYEYACHEGNYGLPDILRRPAC